MAVSDKRSEAVKERDYMLYRKEFQKILQAIGKRFSSTVTENELKVDLSSSNLKTLFKMLDTCGFAGKNKEINAMFRHLHRLKYQL